MLPLLGVLDARSGLWVPRGKAVRYPGINPVTGAEEWWSWHRYRHAGPSGLELWTRNEFKPQGYWQAVYPKMGGLYAMFPS
jgi:hypothetical protein